MPLLGLAHTNLPTAILQFSLPFCGCEIDHTLEVSDGDSGVRRHQETGSLDHCLEDLPIRNITFELGVGKVSTSVVIEPVCISGCVCDNC